MSNNSTEEKTEVTIAASPRYLSEEDRVDIFMKLFSYTLRLPLKKHYCTEDPKMINDMIKKHRYEAVCDTLFTNCK